MTITILSPVGEPIAQPAPSTELAEPRLRGVRLGFLGNTKPNIEVLVDGFTTDLRRLGIPEPIVFDKGHAGRGASSALLAEIVAQCDLVVSAIAD
jgi:hypothetical protein